MENQPITNSSEISSTNQAIVNQPSIPSQAKTNLILPILITLLVSAVFFGLGGYYLGRFSITSSEANNDLNQTSNNLPTPTVPVNTQATLKTYTNEDWGITFQYPEKLDYNGAEVTLKEDANVVSLEAPTEWRISFQRIANKTINQRVAELPKTVLNSPEMTNLGTIKLNGYDTRQVVFKYDQGDNRRILLQHNKDIIEIDTGFVVDPDQILSTFKFTN